MESFGFSTFRELVEKWVEVSKDIEAKDQLARFLDSQNLSLFFKKDKDVYGAPEESRVTFARLKNPDQDTPAGWADIASFSAVNLGNPRELKQTVFGQKDMPNIKIINHEDVINHLFKNKDKSK